MKKWCIMVSSCCLSVLFLLSGCGDILDDETSSASESYAAASTTTKSTSTATTAPKSPTDAASTTATAATTTTIAATTTTSVTPPTTAPKANPKVVFWGHTGDKIHIDPNCRTIKNGSIGGTLDEAKSAGHNGWCGVCSKGWSDDRLLKDGNPNAK